MNDLLPPPKKEVLVVAGAGLHGIYQVGVLETLIKRDGYKPDLMVGCSVGSTTVMGLSHLGFNIAGIEALKAAWFALKNIGSIFGRNLHQWTFPLVANGYYDGAPLQALVRNLVEGKAALTPYELAVCDMLIGQTAYFAPSAADPTQAVSNVDGSHLSLYDALEASYSIPMVVELLKGRWADGGVMDAAPVSRAIDLGATSITVVLGYSLNQDRWGETNSEPSALSVIERVVDVATTRLLIDDVKAAQTSGVPTRIFQPHEDLPIGMLEVSPEHIKEVCAIGNLEA